MFFKIRRLNKTYLVALFFLLISSILILVWFRDGFFYGGGDTGLPTYNPKRILDITKYIWWEAQAPGFLIPHAITSITLYLFLSLLQLIGIGTVSMQAILFLILLFLMGFGMYLLILSIQGQDKKIYAIIGGLFYMFNPFMMVQIWHRFNNTSFFFVASLPFLIIFWRNWIKKGDYLQLLFFLFAGFLSSYMFGTLAYVIPFWLILNLLSVSEILFPWENKKHLWKIIKRSIFGFGMWVIFNSWWLIPVAAIGSGVTSQQHNIGESLATLNAISKQAILPYTVQMINSFYIFAQAELGEIYKSFFFRLIPWIWVMVIFYGIIRALLRKYLAAYVIIYVIIIMLSKGSSSPFGQFFIFLFNNFFVLGLLRNPFEKVGILLPLVSSILFTIGVEDFVKRFHKYLGNFSTASILIVLFIIMGVYYWPMYTGTVFGTIGHPNYNDIPQSYKDADNWLNKKADQNSQADGKILHLPLTRSDIVTYNWNYGYHGNEPSALLFSALPSISHGLNLHRIDDSLTALSEIFNHPYYLQEEKILKLLQAFNVKFIVLHKDIVWKGSDIYDPNEIEHVLDSQPFLERRMQYGDLIIYEIYTEYFQPKVILTNAINLVYPDEATMRIWPYLIGNISNHTITPINNNANKIIQQNSELIVFPNLSFTYLEASESGMAFVINNLALIYYSLLGTEILVNKEDEQDVERQITQIIAANEDLINSYILMKSNNPIQLDALMTRYAQTIDKLLGQDLRKPKLSFYVSPNIITDIYKLHLLILEQMTHNLDQSQKEIIEPIVSKIRQDLKSNKLLPVYPLVNKENLTVMERQINQFNIFKKEEYELLMVNPKSRNLYPNKLSSLDFQVDDKAITLKAMNKGDLISFGDIILNEGLHEISFNHLISENQFPKFDQLTKNGDVKIIDQNTLQLSSDGVSPSFVESPLSQIEGDESYQISFEAFIQSGAGFYIQVIQDTDSEQNGRPNPTVRTAIYQNPQNNNWQSYRIQLPPLKMTTREAKFRLIVDPLGTTSFNPPTGNQPSVVMIRNIQVGRILNNSIYLYSKPQTPIATTAAKILQLNKESPVLYRGKVKIDQPTFMIFSEAFHPEWELELTRDNETYKINEHYLGNLYGNAWWIDKTGEYNFTIEFKPQQKVELGGYLGASGLLILILLILRSKFKQKHEVN